MQEVLDEHIARLNAIGGTSNVLQYFNVGNSEANKVVYSANCYNLFNGAGTMATAAMVINGATDQKAGAMTAPPMVLPQVLRLSHENQRVLRGEHWQGILWHPDAIGTGLWQEIDTWSIIIVKKAGHA